MAFNEGYIEIQSVTVVTDMHSINIPNLKKNTKKQKKSMEKMTSAIALRDT